MLVVDNGGDTIKFDLLPHHSLDSSDAKDADPSATVVDPESMPNVTAKLQHQFTVLVGDEINSVQPTQLGRLTRSMERGCITDLGNQVQVWKRMLDRLQIQVSLDSEAAQAFGWKVSRQKQATQSQYRPEDMAVLLLLPPHFARSILDQVLYVWFQDFGFGHVGVATSSTYAGQRPETTLSSAESAASTGCSCVVDLGWGGTNIVPTYRQKPLSAVKRLPLGGRHMVNLWKHYCSYRQWNLMDAEFLLRDVQHQLAYVSTDPEGDFREAHCVPAGRRSFDREYVLPDYQTVHEGSVRLSGYLRMQLRRQQASEEKRQENERSKRNDDDKIASTDGTNKDKTNSKNEKSDDHDGDSENESGSESESSEHDDANGNSGKDKDDDDDKEEDDDADSDNETDEQKRKRLMRMKAEEEQRQRELEMERQVLDVSVERFTIPEV